VIVLSPSNLESVCRCNADIGRYSITELHLDDIANNKLLGAKVNLLAVSDGNCILQLTTSDDRDAFSKDRPEATGH